MDETMQISITDVRMNFKPYILRNNKEKIKHEWFSYTIVSHMKLLTTI